MLSYIHAREKSGLVIDVKREQGRETYMSNAQRLTVFFVGGGTKEFVLPNAVTVAANIKNNEWVEIGDCQINAKHVSYYSITDLNAHSQ